MFSNNTSLTPQSKKGSRNFVLPSDEDKGPLRRAQTSGEKTNSNLLEDYSPKKKRELPMNFAEEVLDLELEMERETVDIELVKQLIELYTLAMEYYEARKSDKHTVFLSKMQTLLTKPNVIKTMCENIESSETSNYQMTESKDRKMDDFMRNVNSGSKNHKQDAGYMIKHFEDGKVTSKSIYMQSMCAQKTAMKKKLEARKRLKMKLSQEDSSNKLCEKNLAIITKQGNCSQFTRDMETSTYCETLHSVEKFMNEDSSTEQFKTETSEDFDLYSPIGKMIEKHEAEQPLSQSTQPSNTDHSDYSALTEETKQKLIETIDLDNIKEIQALKEKFNFEKEQKVLEVREKANVQRTELDNEETPAMVKKKLLQKISKEEEDELKRLDEEYETLLINETYRLEQSQKQQKLPKLAQISN